MNRRSILKFFGLAPLAAVIPAVAAVPDRRWPLEKHASLEEFMEWARAEGIVIDIDVSKVDQHGRQPPRIA